ncbi:MAG TPA: cytochrome c maturation protein CcmE [Candidatus Limnocylindria bacterium]|nr:cytochrome c maturation protein CcmE [Candidatus Limnocylindria bacterium]
MTVRAPAPPALPRRRRRWGIVLGAAVALGAIVLLAFGSIGSALVYYLTPSELVARGERAVGETVRVGGLVEPGSVSGPPTDLRFVLTDGQTHVAVRADSAPTSSFREGTGAVVEGTLGVDGVFRATRVIVKHDENYEAPAPGETPGGSVFVPAEEPGRP